MADSLKGSVFIQTANDDKANNQQNLFSIIISDCIGSRVFFLFDKRIYSTQLYNWMPQKKFQEVHPLITSTDKDANYILYTYTITKEKDTLYIGGNQSVIDKKNRKNIKKCSSNLIIFKEVQADHITNFNNLDKDKHSFKLLVTGPDSLSFQQKIIDHDLWLNGKKGMRLDNLGKISNKVCYNGNLIEADLSSTIIDSSGFNSSLLNNVEFSNSTFTNVNFFNSHLDSTNFNKAILKNCMFLGSDLRGAIFTNTKFKNVDFSCANMAGVIFEPDSLPNIQGIASSYNLDSITYRTDPGALIKLKEKLKTAGFTDAHRKVTAAIQRKKHTLTSSTATKFIDYLLFDFTSSYGLNPLRPLILLLILIYVFYKTYLFLFFIDKLKIHIKHAGTSGEMITDKIHPGRLLFLSIITSFAIGFGPYNINDWAKKLLAEDYILQPWGYTRILIGIQNLISLYLFSLTILLLFGDPFSFW
ncbi:pentapeptide repeat-containing protein [Mucilaginibacter paludis]|uniref:pentapeptide repeat-containing protein n=1 Tax=Mucilaginibacter paludis TaxID=423351 RepID=UPI0012FCB938|nr:pentapeptide repeat-containing protein [Mucilaginibacter paludis]